jgi:hypothetical protein
MTPDLRCIIELDYSSPDGVLVRLTDDNGNSVEQLAGSAGQALDHMLTYDPTDRFGEFGEVRSAR